MNKQYHNDDNDDDAKFYPTRFYLPYCDECKQYREFINIICSHCLTILKVKLFFIPKLVNSSIPIVFPA